MIKRAYEVSHPFFYQDPFVALNIQDEHGIQKSAVVKTGYQENAGSTAKFDQTLNIPYSPRLDILHLELFDHNKTTAHELLGSENVDLRVLFASHNTYSLPFESGLLALFPPDFPFVCTFS